MRLASQLISCKAVNDGRLVGMILGYPGLIRPLIFSTFLNFISSFPSSSLIAFVTSLMFTLIMSTATMIMINNPDDYDASLASDNERDNHDNAHCSNCSGNDNDE